MRSRVVAALGVAVGVAVLVALPAGAQPTEKPRLEPARVAGEVIVGAYAGIGGFVAGRFVGVSVADAMGADSDMTRRRAGVIGGVVGGGLATAGAVYAIGGIGDQTSDFNATLLGTSIGYFAALGIAHTILGPEMRPPEGMSTKARWATANVLALLPAIGATIAFNSARRTQ